MKAVYSISSVMLPDSPVMYHGFEVMIVDSTGVISITKTLIRPVFPSSLHHSTRI